MQNFHERQDVVVDVSNEVPVETQNLVRGDFELFCETCVQIRDRDGEGLIPFKLREVQRRIIHVFEFLFATKGRVRVALPKSRQQGVSTLLVVYFLWRAMYTRNFHANITAHLADSTSILFKTAKDVYENLNNAQNLNILPQGFVPPLEKSNARVLSFVGLQSYISISTAGSKQAGRGTSLNALHLSEAAFFDNAADIVKGLVSAVSGITDSFICQESTGMPFGPFKALVLDAVKDGSQSEWVVVFLSVLMDPAAVRDLPVPGDLRYPFKPPPDFAALQAKHGMSDEQIYYYYQQNSTIAAMSSGDPDTIQPGTLREYPLELADCFTNENAKGFFPPQDVLAARAARHYPPNSSIPVLGCDVGGERGTSDRTHLMDRQGTVIGGRVNLSITGPYELQVRQIASIALEIGARFIAVDYTNNQAFVTLLKQVLPRTCKVIPVHFAEKPNFPELHANRRAEMHDLFRMWLAAPRLWGDPAVSIPDDERLNAQMAAYQWLRGQCRRSAKGVLTMTEKAYISEEYLESKSPDELDSCVLTFAVPDQMITKLLQRQLELLRLQQQTDHYDHSQH